MLSFVIYVTVSNNKYIHIEYKHKNAYKMNNIKRYPLCVCVSDNF